MPIRLCFAAEIAALALLFVLARLGEFCFVAFLFVG